jgi:hypothetical protein
MFNEEKIGLHLLSSKRKVAYPSLRVDVEKINARE